MEFLNRNVAFLLLFNIFLLLAILISFTSCTLSFQNVDTHGEATDLIDDTQDAKADFKIPLEMPPLG